MIPGCSICRKKKPIHMAHIERATEDDNNEYANPICSWDAEWDKWGYTNNWDDVTCKKCLKRRKADELSFIEEASP